MKRGDVIACVLLASICVGGCARSHRHAPLTSNPAHSRDSHQELAGIAADVVAGLQQRVEADEPLTPEFTELLCVWSRREHLNKVAATTSRAERAAAADARVESLRSVYDLFHSRVIEEPELIAPQLLTTEYYLAEAEYSVLGKRGASMQGRRALSVIAREIWDSLQKRMDNDEPLTPELVRLLCAASRRLCLDELSSEAAPTDPRRITTEHAERLGNLLSALELVSSEGPSPFDAVAYYVAEAKLWVEEAESGQSQRESELRRAMDEAARRHFASLRKRREADEPMTPEFVEKLCDWSEKVCRAEEATHGDREREPTPTAREDHLRRMRDLHADLKRRLDEKDADVTRIQVSQAAYFLREAELGSEAPGR